LDCFERENRGASDISIIDENRIMKVYCVGGAVRDELLGLPVVDHDWVVVGETPEKMRALGFKQVGKDFPVFLHPETQEEYALARTEKKVGSGYQGFQCHADPSVTLEEDLARRDLTINAIARAPDGTLIDPFHGQQDLQNRLLRHVSPAFREDPLRVLRVARFMARYAPLGFHVAEETLVLMRHMSSELTELSSERVWMEFEKALAASAPQAFIQTLRACHALTVILPEIDALYGVPQPPEHHPEVDTGKHIELVLEQAAKLSPDPVVRFAALMHDVGKGATPPNLWPKHHGHEEKGVELVKKCCERLKVPNHFTALALAVTQYHGLVYRIEELRPATVLKVLSRIDAFRRPERLSLFLQACEADFRGRPGFETRPDIVSNVWMRCFEAAQAVDVKAHITPAMTGPDIEQTVLKLRIGAIQGAK
jgi:tRNA nucleotidyltransferase (CCA-adding enzyme)